MTKDINDRLIRARERSQGKPKKLIPKEDHVAEFYLHDPRRSIRRVQPTAESFHFRLRRFERL